MGQFTLELQCDNAAFEEWETEVARILRDTADRLDRHDGRERNYYRDLRDINGNIVGYAGFERRRATRS